MRDVDFRVQLFRTELERPRSERALGYFLATLTAINCDYLRQYPQTPKLYDAGVRYKAEPSGQEEWKDVPTVRLDGHGDCEDLACWRTAELIVSGIQARPIFKYQRVTPEFSLYHIQVRWPNGRIEDPSKVLGMGAK